MFHYTCPMPNETPLNPYLTNFSRDNVPVMAGDGAGGEEGRVHREEEGDQGEQDQEEEGESGKGESKSFGSGSEFESKTVCKHA
jgi:hypothetical protein